jgi:hypothetical protein
MSLIMFILINWVPAISQVYMVLPKNKSINLSLKQSNNKNRIKFLNKQKIIILVMKKVNLVSAGQSLLWLTFKKY